MGGIKSKTYIYSEELPGTETEAYSSIFKPLLDPERIQYPNVYYILKTICEEFPTKPLLGYKPTMSPSFKWMTCASVLRKIEKCSSFLSSLNIETNDQGLRLIGIIAKNSPEWVVFDVACAKEGITSVPLYETNTSTHLELMFSILKLQSIVCSRENLLRLYNLKRSGKVEELRIVLCLQKPTNEERHLAEVAGVKLYYYCTRVKSRSEFVERSFDYIFTLALTSGVGGEVKICIVSNGNILHSIHGANLLGLDLQMKDIYMSYVPLALLWERVLLYKVLLCACSIGFVDLNSSEFSSDLKLLKPSGFLGIPRLLENIYDNIQQRLSLSTPTKRSLFQKAFISKLKTFKKDGSVVSTILDKFIFKTIKSELGGNVRIIITGSAQFRAGVLDFLRVVLSCKISEGYGSMETLITCLCSVPGDKITNHLGGPLPGYLAKLKKIQGAEIAEYEGKLVGELCVKGEKVFKGYYKGGDSCIDSEGWLHTGDYFVYLPENKSFQFIDLSICLIKTPDGNLFSIQRLEMIYKACKFVSQILIVPRKGKLIALIVPEEKQIIERAQSATFEQMCKKAEIVQEVFNSLLLIFLKSGLKEYEKIWGVYLEPQPWISDEFMAPTMKLRRPLLEAKYNEIIESLLISGNF